MDRLALLCIYCAVFIHGPEAARILLAPFPYSSHVSELVHIGEALIERGHSVTIMLSESYPKVSDFKSKSSRMPVMEYRVKHKDFYLFPEEENPMADSLIGVPAIEDFRSSVEGFTEFCYNALEDEDFYRRIKHEKFDLAIVDAFPCTRCYFILFYRLNIPYVSVTTQHEPWLYRNPAVPSFVPFGMSTPPKSDRMTFAERFHNLVQLIDWSAFPGIPYLDDSLVSTYAPEMPFVTLDWLAGQSLLWLIDTDTALDYPRPMMPNEINIGGLSTKPGKQLVAEVLDLVNKAENGVIVASFGSIDILNEDIFSRFLQAFSSIPKTVQIFMRYTKEVPAGLKIPSNLKLMKWLPQNDLLGHPKTKIFITHGGANSHFEGLYHAVPMIMFPLFADQPYNAKRSEVKGHSVTMDIMTFQPGDLVKNIKLMLYSDNSFKKAIQKDSDIFKSAVMNPRERSVYWIEHVIEFGGAHLRSHALDMPWYQYLMLDIAAFLTVILCFILFVIYMLIRCICSTCCERKGPTFKYKSQ